MAGLHVTEIFHSIQGESTWAGLPCVFVRLTGCPMRCRWCDTAYAFSGGTRWTEEEIVLRVGQYSCPLVEITGGEPLAQADARDLMRRLADLSYTVLVETGGAYSIEGLDPRLHVILDVKCPDSGECERNHWDNLNRLKPGDELKFVLASRRDYEWARDLIRERRLEQCCPVLFSPVWSELSPLSLSRWVLEDGLTVRVQVQLHKVIFGPQAQGV